MATTLRRMLKRALGLVAVYAIALQAVLGVWAGPLSAAQASDPLAILCSGAAADSASPGDPASSHRADCACGMTCTHMAMGALAAGAAGLSVADPVLVARVRESGVAAPLSHRHGLAQPRAPPMRV